MIPNEMMRAHDLSNKIMTILYTIFPNREMQIDLNYKIQLSEKPSTPEAEYLLYRLEVNGWISEYDPNVNQVCIKYFDPMAIQMTIQSF